MKGPNAPGSTVGVDDASKGRVEGQLLDEEDLPVNGASVGLRGATSLDATSDDNGRFTFLGVEPGDYDVLVAKLGYSQASERVLVKAGETTEVNLKLVAVEIVGPYHKLQQQQGYLQCTVRVSPGVPLAGAVSPGWYTGVNTCGVVCIAECVPIWPEDKFLLTWDVNLTGTQEMLLEMQWQSTQALGKALSVALEHDGHINDGTPIYGTRAGTSPLVVYADSKKVNEVWTHEKVKVAETCSQASLEQGCKYVTRVFGSANLTNFDIPVEPPAVPVFGAPPKRVDVGWTMDQKFEQYFTTFHNMNRPSDYTALE